MSNLIDELLDTYDAIDIGTEATKIDRQLILETAGLGEMGDKNPIKAEDVKSWRALKDEYFELVRKKSILAQSVRILLAVKPSKLICRCFTSKNAEALFDKLSVRWEKIT